MEGAGAGAVLIAAIALTAGVGALVGWAAGSVAFGAGVGAALGIPTGILAVYHRYG